MKVKAFEIFNAQSIDGMEWEDILQIVPMGNGRAIVLMKDQKGKLNDHPQGKKRAVDPLIEEYEQEFDKRCKEALYDVFGGTEKIKFDYLASETRCIENVIIAYVENGWKKKVSLDLRNRPETYKYIAFKRKEDEL